MKRRELLAAAVAGLVGAHVAPDALGAEAAGDGGDNGTPFDYETLVALAQAAAAEAYRQPETALDEPFADLSYDQYRAIRFREERLIWGDGDRRFAIDLMPPGFFFGDRVRVHLVAGGRAREVAFSTDFFHFHPTYFPYDDGAAPAGLAEDHGFSGLRLRHPINRPGVWDEVAVFQGASYFRSVARDTLYGLSARGIAIGTGEPEPEEFPLFAAFWVEEPEPGEDAVRLYALLDGPSVAGAFAFELRPGAETVMDVRAALFPRTAIDKVGIAPLTSMYFFGPERRAGVDDFRDAVHDSCGLHMVNGGGETLWRPLVNPPSLQFSAFQDRGPRAFGLLQRQRAFEHYQDAEARYEKRPSAWIEPEDDWGAGAVVLIEIPTLDEFADNIVAFWRPDEPLAAGRRHDFAYRLTWGRDVETPASLARVVATRGGGSILDERERVFVVDFDLGTRAIDDLEPRLTVSAGEIAGTIGLSRLPEANVARVGFHHVAGEAEAAEFRLELVGPDGPASEVWLYRWLRG